MRCAANPLPPLFAILVAGLLLGGPVVAAAQEFGPPTAISNPFAPLYDERDYQPQVTTDGAGNWVAAWWSGVNPGNGWDILVARSTDNGATWTAPIALDTGADFGDDHEPQLATDGAGNWVIVWSSSDSLGGTIGGDFDILVARSTDNGATWTARAALNTNAAADSGIDFSPQVATDGAGNWVAAWYSGDSLGGTIGTDNDILLARSTDNGMTWTAPAMLNIDAASDSGDDWSPQVTTDGAGNWVATWFSDDSLGGTIGTDYDILVARSADSGATWTAPVALNTNAAVDSGDDLSPQVTTDGAGNWVAAWHSTDTLGGTIGYPGNDILVARSTDSGATWTAPAPLNTNAPADSGDNYQPQVATDGAGLWVAVWSSQDSLGGTIGIDWDIVFARSTDNGATWTPPAALNTNAGADSGHDLAPQFTTDGMGHWLAAWHSDDGLGGPAEFDVPDILVALGGVCGDGTLAGPENCDDGGLVNGDCCSSGCSFESLASPCVADGIPCTIDICNGAGVCGVGDDAQCDDVSTCTTDTCEVGTGCVHDATPVDGSLCFAAPNTKLQIADSADPAKDKLVWQWSRGEGFDQFSLGTPLDDTRYALCVYDTSVSVPSLVAAVEIAPSPTLWTSEEPTGFDYDDKPGTSDGVTKLQLRTGGPARTRIKLSAKGANLTLPSPFGATYFEQSPQVVAQLVNSVGTCWTSEFVAADNKKTTGTSFKAQTK